MILASKMMKNNSDTIQIFSPVKSMNVPNGEKITIDTGVTMKPPPNSYIFRLQNRKILSTLWRIIHFTIQKADV